MNLVPLRRRMAVINVHRFDPLLHFVLCDEIHPQPFLPARPQPTLMMCALRCRTIRGRVVYAVEQIHEIGLVQDRREC
jgi:hypothetical protein